MNTNFDQIIKDRMKDYFESKGIINPVSTDYGKSFLYFYTKEIAGYMNSIYEDDLEDGFDCDGKGDLGIDFLLRKEDGTLLVVQSKYKGHRTSLSSDDVANFFQVPQRVLNKTFINQHSNENMKFHLKDLNLDDAIDFIFVTNDKITPRLKDEFENQKTVAESTNTNHTFYFKGYSELKKEYAMVQTINDPIPDEVTIYIERVNDTVINHKRCSYLDISDLIDNDKKYKSVICTVKGTHLKNLWNQYPGTLFNYNIRGFLGQNAVNKKMKRTIDEEPEKFYFYNNGISAICTELKPKFDETTNEVTSFVCKNFQIINGAQTTTTIGKYRIDANLQRVRVLLKLTKTEDIKAEKKGLNKNIITFNNSQNVIKDSDFRSNDDIQSFLQRKFDEHYYRGCQPIKRLRYVPKRVHSNKSREHLIITMELLGRVLYVYDYDPTLIFRGTRALFDISDSGKYYQIFGDNGSEVPYFDDKRTNKVIALSIIWTRLDELITTKQRALRLRKMDKTIEYQATLAKWHFLWVYGEVLRKLYHSDLDAIYKKIISGKVFENADFIECWFERIFNKITEILEKNYRAVKNGQAEDDLPAFNLKNWLREKAAFEDFKDSFRRLIKEDYVIKIPIEK